ncbi:cytidine deaminase [Sphaerochaeta associata]|uniref:Cytidine deaminase n=1 Tax=Sphaerochaeta associata TaxID=1129264 RepID=A0ABY4D7C3_9SPIR|nr:cytidine deaminase [Sphaerochaeta associata]UOM50194.1 cytidine deaminase [Sphaerochaeta associata]SMP43819.1 cytidine deaminase [Sphaerochaeta associata]
MIKGILFDMDGVLIDSEPVILQAALAYLSDIGITAQPEDFIPFIGTGDKRYLCGVGEKYGVSIDFEQAKKALFSYYQRFANNRGPMPGVLRFIANARKAGLKLALATSAQRMKAAINLEAIGLKFEDFDMVVTGDVVKRTKPNPDIYQLSGLSLGLSTDECLVVEDALNGVQAGKAAGCSVCALESTFTVTELSDAGADYVLSSLDAFEDFSSIEDFNALLASYGGSDGRTVFGANKVLEAGQARMGEKALLEYCIEQAAKARKNAYTPYSGYKVGAAVVSAKTNRVYSGCNVENSSYGATICAERNAILNAIASEGTIGIKMVVVVSQDAPPAPPCAHCLQVLAEFSRPETEIHLVDVDFAEGRGGDHTVYAFSELLPHPFIFPSMRL